MPLLKQDEAAKVSRRTLLIAGAAAGGGLFVGWLPSGDAAQPNAAASFAPNAFVRIDRAGKVTVISPMIEMGQGTYTSLPMLVAEELDVDMKNVSVEHAPPNDKLYGNSRVGGAQITGNSASICAFFLPMRQAGAAARAMLIAAAAAKLGTDPAGLKTEAGFVVDAASGKRLDYGALVDDAAKLPVPTNVNLKEPADFRIIGTPAKRLDIAGKVDGTAMFGIDVKLPGMKIATIAASPVFGGTLASCDESAALAVPGVRQIVKLDNAVAVIADHYWAARQGLTASNPTFNDGQHATVTTADIVSALAKVAEKPGAVAKNEGDAEEVLSKAGCQARSRSTKIHSSPMRPWSR